MRALGLDIGLSGVRATIVDDKGRLLATAGAGRAAVVAHGRASHDPRRWREAVFTAARAVLHEAGPVDVIGIGALGSAPFLVDAAGEPIGEALLFSLDARAEAERQELGLTGDHALPKLRWLVAHHGGAVRASDVGGWIAEQLTGLPTMDAITRLTWTPELGLPVPIPDPVDPLSHAALRTDALGLPRGTPVVTGTLDSYVDVYAAGCRAPGDGCVLLGSTLIVYGVCAGEVHVAGLELQAYPGRGLLLGGSTSSGGNVIDWARRTFGAEIATGPPAGPLRVLPYLAGERTPLRDPEATGAVLGITLTTTAAELHRAFVDGIALAALDHAERIASAVTVERWRVSGGGVRNPAWLQATADALSAPLELAPLAGEGAGPALFALAAMGADPPPVAGGRIEPDPEAARRYRDALHPYRARHAHLQGAP
jgi:xylulokinase